MCVFNDFRVGLLLTWTDGVEVFKRHAYSLITSLSRREKQEIEEKKTSEREKQTYQTKIEHSFASSRRITCIKSNPNQMHL